MKKSFISAFCITAFICVSISAQNTTKPNQDKEEATMAEAQSEKQLIFTFDAAGNQTKRFFCDNPDCKSSFEEALSETATENRVFKLYPNPTTTELHVAFLEGYSETMESLKIYNTGAILVRSLKSTEQKHLKINMRDLPSGVYLVHMHLKNGEQITKKIVKE